MKKFISLSLLCGISMWSTSVVAASGNNQMYITQTNKNHAEAWQDCGPDGCNNYGSIVQVNPNNGTGNNAYLKQVKADSTAYITQGGNDNNTVVRQRNHAYADARQTTSSGSFVTINQDMDDVSGTIAGANNTASAYQTDGTAQVAWIKQFGDNDTAHTRQSGTGNNVKIIQNAGSMGETAFMEQHGTANWTDVVMNGQQDSVVTGQNGSNQNIDIDIATSARRSKVTAYQTGNNNNTKLYTQGVEDVIFSDQTGSDNYMEITQLGNQQKAQVVQGGTGNNTLIGQYELATGSTALTNQFGSNHNAAIYQNCPQSIASISQSGTGANAVIRQNP